MDVITFRVLDILRFLWTVTKISKKSWKHEVDVVYKKKKVTIVLSTVPELLSSSSKLSDKINYRNNFRHHREKAVERLEKLWRTEKVWKNIRKSSSSSDDSISISCSWNLNRESLLLYHARPESELKMYKTKSTDKTLSIQ